MHFLDGKQPMETVNGARLFIKPADHEEIGFDPARFVDLKTENFNCGICQYVVRDPKLCEDCGQMFCSSCLLNWLKINR